MYTNDLLQITFSFIYAIILAPWNDPIFFVVWLVLLEIAYLAVFTLDPVTQLGIISAYLLGWIVGRQLMICYEDDPFVPNKSIWKTNDREYSGWFEQLTSMFRVFL